MAWRHRVLRVGPRGVLVKHRLRPNCGTPGVPNTCPHYALHVRVYFQVLTIFRFFIWLP